MDASHAAGRNTGRRPFTQDMIILCEFCEQRGPAVVMTYPENVNTHLALDNIAMRVLSCDYARGEELMRAEDKRWKLPEDSYGIMPFPEELCFGYVHNFSLYDIAARGYARPLVLVFLSSDQTKLLDHFLSLSLELRHWANMLKTGSSHTFIRDLEHKLESLETLSVQAFSESVDDSVFELVMQSRGFILKNFAYIRDRLADFLLENAISEDHTPIHDNDASPMGTPPVVCEPVVAAGIVNPPLLSSPHQMSAMSISADDVSAHIAQVLRVLQKRSDFEERLRTLADICTPQVHDRATTFICSLQRYYQLPNCVLHCDRQDKARMAAGAPPAHLNSTSAVDRSSAAAAAFSASAQRPSLFSLGGAFMCDFALGKVTFDQKAGSIEAPDSPSSDGPPSTSAPRKSGDASYVPTCLDFDHDAADRTIGPSARSGNARQNSVSPSADIVSAPIAIPEKADAWSQSSGSVRFLTPPGSTESFHSLSDSGSLLGGAASREIDDLPSSTSASASVTSAAAVPGSTAASKAFSDGGSDDEDAVQNHGSKTERMRPLESFYVGLFRNPRHAGSGLLRFLSECPFWKPMVFSLLTGRMLIVSGSAANEQLVRDIVRTLSLFVVAPRLSVRGRRPVSSWRTRPIRMEHVGYLRLCGLSKSAYIPRGIEPYVSIYDVDRGTLQAPMYDGDLLSYISTRKNHWPSEATYLCHVHTILLEISLKAFLFYHFHVMGYVIPPVVPPGVLSSASLQPSAGPVPAIRLATPVPDSQRSGVKLFRRWRQRNRSSSSASESSSASSAVSATSHVPVMPVSVEPPQTPCSPPSTDSNGYAIWRPSVQQVAALIDLRRSDIMIVKSMCDMVKDQLMFDHFRRLPTVRLDVQTPLTFFRPTVQPKTKQRSKGSE
jgi:hypothetical protein